MGVGVFYKCDLCGAERKETNHWYLAHSDPAYGIAASKAIVIRAFYPVPAIYAGKMFCGMACLIQYLSSSCPKLHTKEEIPDAYEFNPKE